MVMIKERKSIYMAPF